MHWFWKWILSGVIGGIALRFFGRAAEVSLIARAGLHVIWILPSLALIVQAVCWIKIPSPTPAYKFLFWSPIAALFDYSNMAMTVLSALEYDRRLNSLTVNYALISWAVFTVIILALAFVMRKKHREKLVSA